jgi:DnaJ-class molecular chaperone
MTIETRFVTCDRCGGDGVLVFGTFEYEPGCGYGHESSDERPCPVCDGAGVIEREVKPLSMEEALALDQEKLDALLEETP